jgi:hypothetical protein
MWLPQANTSADASDTLDRKQVVRDYPSWDRLWKIDGVRGSPTRQDKERGWLESIGNCANKRTNDSNIQRIPDFVGEPHLKSAKSKISEELNDAERWLRSCQISGIMRDTHIVATETG